MVINRSNKGQKIKYIIKFRKGTVHLTQRHLSHNIWYGVGMDIPNRHAIEIAKAILANVEKG